MNLPPCTDPVAQTLRHLRKLGLSYSQIAAEMNRRGIPAPRGSEWTSNGARTAVDIAMRESK